MGPKPRRIVTESWIKKSKILSSQHPSVNWILKLVLSISERALLPLSILKMGERIWSTLYLAKNLNIFVWICSRHNLNLAPAALYWENWSLTFALKSDTAPHCKCEKHILAAFLFYRCANFHKMFRYWKTSNIFNFKLQNCKTCTIWREKDICLLWKVTLHCIANVKSRY